MTGVTEKKRIVFHLDMDHFFTAVEERERPDIRGKPVIVGADPKGGTGRGVVSTSNYEARKFGVRSGMPISRAYRLCPEGVYLPVNFDLYGRVSDEIMTLLRGHADKFEQWGVDEAFLDVTSTVKDYAEAEELARQIKKEILEKEGLTCTIGIGPNKLIAKIATEVKKPDGLTVVREEQVESFLSDLPVRRLLWVGKKTEQKLLDMGIKTIGDLARYDPSVLTETFGVVGTQLYLMAHGVDGGDVAERGEVKSIGRESTFEEDTDDFDAVLAMVDKLAKHVHEDMIGRKFFFRTVTIRVRYENFETHIHGKTLPFMSDRLVDIQKTARELMWQYLRPDRKVRLVGVRVSNFVSADRQKTLF